MNFARFMALFALGMLVGLLLWSFATWLMG